MNTYYIVYGPPCSGKTLNKEALRRHFGCSHVFDDGIFSLRDLAEGKHTVLILSQGPNVKDPFDRRRLLRRSARTGEVFKYPVTLAKKFISEEWIEPRAA